MISTKFCTWNDSSAVLTRAMVCGSLRIWKLSWCFSNVNVIRQMLLFLSQKQKCPYLENNATNESLQVNIYTVLKIQTICHARDLWKLAWSCKLLHLLCLPNLWSLLGTALFNGFQSSWWSFEIHWVRQYSANVVLFGIKDLQTPEMTVKLKSNLYVRHVNIVPKCDTVYI